MQEHSLVETITRVKAPCASKATTVSQSNSDGSKVCFRSVGAQTEAEQSKSSQTDYQRKKKEEEKTEEKKITAPVEKSAEKSNKESRGRYDDEDPSRFEPNDSSSKSSSDIDPPLRKIKKIKVRPEKEEKNT